MLSGFKIYQPIQFGIFLTFATIKVVGEPKQQNLISAKQFVKRTGCPQPSNSLADIDYCYFWRVAQTMMTYMKTYMET